MAWSCNANIGLAVPAVCSGLSEDAELTDGGTASKSTFAASIPDNEFVVFDDDGTGMLQERQDSFDNQEEIDTNAKIRQLTFQYVDVS